MMKTGHVMVVGAVLIAGCSSFGQTAARKPAGTHYSPAFIRERELVVFPFEGDRVSIDLPAKLGDVAFSSDGRVIYGVSRLSGEGKRLVAVTIKPSGVSQVPGSEGLDKIDGLAVNANEDKAVVSAIYDHDGISDCGLFELSMPGRAVKKILDNLSTSCDFLSSWTELSVSGDGMRMVGTAGRGQVGVVNLSERRVEKLWPGTAAWWSPDGKWIAALSFSNQLEIELIRASDLSVQRKLGAGAARLQWSPDSRYLLLVAGGLCGLGTGYFGTLQTLDVETGERRLVSSSKCRVNLMTTGWVDDAVLK
jgi:hypothetical protein